MKANSQPIFFGSLSVQLQGVTSLSQTDCSSALQQKWFERFVSTSMIPQLDGKMWRVFPSHVTQPLRSPILWSQQVSSVEPWLLGGIPGLKRNVEDGTSSAGQPCSACLDLSYKLGLFSLMHGVSLSTDLGVRIDNDVAVPSLDDSSKFGLHPRNDGSKQPWLNILEPEMAQSHTQTDLKSTRPGVAP